MQTAQQKAITLHSGPGGRAHRQDRPSCWTLDAQLIRVSISRPGWAHWEFTCSTLCAVRSLWAQPLRDPDSWVGPCDSTTTNPAQGVELVGGKLTLDLPPRSTERLVLEDLGTRQSMVKSCIEQQLICGSLKRLRTALTWVDARGTGKEPPGVVTGQSPCRTSRSDPRWPLFHNRSRSNPRGSTFSKGEASQLHHWAALAKSLNSDFWQPAMSCEGTDSERSLLL